jgi:hypothetical protein
MTDKPKLSGDVSPAVVNGSHLSVMDRRGFLSRAGLALAGVGLAGQALAQAPGAAGATARLGVLPAGHFAARAKRVIFMHMSGGLSQVDTFDYKPTLERMHGQEIPPSVRNTQRLSAMVKGQTSYPIVKPLRPFRQHGQSGAWVSGLLPYTAKIADDLCFVKSMSNPQVNHHPAALSLHTGFQLSGRPSAGAWVSYGLGSENSSLPSHITLVSPVVGGAQTVDPDVWGSGFLPSHFAGVLFRSGADPVLYVNSPEGIVPTDRRRALDVIQRLSMEQYDRSGDPEILSRMSQYEMAYRMQSSVPDVVNISDEPKHILDMYGPDVHTPGTYARNCLLARRLAERDVKYINLIQKGWDAHFGIATGHPKDCKLVDQPTAALVADLKQRGLLEDTLVVFGTEFGRTAFAQGALDPGVGRDHNIGAFTVWLAGAGIKAGTSYGETDEFSYNVVKDPVAINDLHATMLHLLGVDHEKFTYRHLGRDYRLTDVAGKVVHGILT